MASLLSLVGKEGRCSLQHFTLRRWFQPSVGILRGLGLEVIAGLWTTSSGFASAIFPLSLRLSIRECYLAIQKDVAFEASMLLISAPRYPLDGQKTAHPMVPWVHWPIRTTRSCWLKTAIQRLWTDSGWRLERAASADR